MMAESGAQPTLALQDPVPAQYDSLPGVAAIGGVEDVGLDYDAVFALDCSSVDRLGSVYLPALAELPLLVIDHHVTNTRYGSVNWVEPGNAATCQMLVALADALGVPMTADLAACLLTGIVTDTLAFRTSNTTPEVLAAATRLMQSGGSLIAITETMLDQRPFPVVLLWGMVLDHAQMEDGVIWATVSRRQFAAAGVHNHDDGSLSSLLIRTVGSDMSATFVERAGNDGAAMVECSFRARRGFDISQVALQLGGGGHPGAGGCTLEGSLEHAVAVVVPMLKATRAVQRAAVGV
jgi:phosphoesterase RecJ-like protein